jgi:hypothetical protein
MISISKVLLDDDLSLCSPLARVLFIGLLYKYNCDEINVNSFRRIKAEILPYDDCDMFLLFEELAKNGLIHRQDVDDEYFEFGFYVTDSEYFNA